MQLKCPKCGGNIDCNKTHAHMSTYRADIKCPHCGFENKENQKLFEDMKAILVGNINNALFEYVSYMTDAMSKIDQASDINDIMNIKKDLLFQQVKFMLLSSKYCPYCINIFLKDELNDCEDCEDCYYGETYGYCGDDDSAYGIIPAIKKKLRDAISNYWKDESDSEETK